MSRIKGIQSDPEGRQENQAEAFMKVGEGRCLCGKKLSLGNLECYSHMTKGY